MKATVIYRDGSRGYRQIQTRNGKPTVTRDHRQLTLRAIKPGFIYEQVRASEYHAPKPHLSTTPWWME